MSRSTIWSNAAWVLLIAIFCLNVYRAVTQSITTDEAFTYARFVSTPSAGLVERFDANNHVLNSLLDKASVALFGLNEWTLRLPSLLGGALYLFAAYRLCFLLFGGGAWSFLTTALLCTNPLLLDHLSAARGYGLALAFLLLSIRQLIRAAEAAPFRSLYAAGILCGLSIAANMTSLFPVTAITVSFIAVTAARGEFQLKKLWDEFVVPMSLISFLFLVLPLSRMEAGSFYFGALHLVDSIRTLAQLSFDYDPFRTDRLPLISYLLQFLSGLVLPFLSLLLLGSIGYVAIDLIKSHRHRSAESRPGLIACFFALAFAAAVLLIVAAHWIAATPYPLMRTALYFVPLIVLAASSLAYRYRDIRPAGYSSFAVGLLCLIAFVCQVNVSFYSEWRFDAGTRRIVDFIRSQTPPGKRLVVSASWVLEPSLNFYRVLDHLNWQPIDRGGPEKPGDMVVVTQENHASIARLGLQVIYKDPVSGTVVALPNGAANSPPTMTIAAVTAAGQSPPLGPAPLQPQATDPGRQQLRQARRALWDNMFGTPGHESAPAIESADPRTPPPVTSVDEMTVEELPARYADTILVGQITAVQSYQSNDRRAIYTESTVKVEQVIDQQGSAAAAGGIVAIDQPGGSITLPGGRVIRHLISGLGNPLANGGRYAFFLVYVPKAQRYKLTKAWGLNNGVAVALSQDDLARARNNTSQYNGMPEAAFIAALKTLKASYRGNLQ